MRDRKWEKGWCNIYGRNKDDANVRKIKMVGVNKREKGRKKRERKKEKIGSEREDK